MPQGVYRLCFLLRGVPERSIHPRCSFAWIFGHSLHCDCSAAQRMGQETLQGLHLAPSPGLTRLYDTPLEPTHVLVTLLPIDGMPGHHIAGSRTSSHACRHLLCLLSRFAQFSRNERRGFLHDPSNRCITPSRRAEATGTPRAC